MLVPHTPGESGMLTIVCILGALVLLDVLAILFGHDSRGGFPRDS
jgi:hypothetical protein